MIAQTPPMGWNSWDCYGASVNEATIRKNAVYMAENLKKHGYNYIVNDIQWYEPTAENHQYHNFAELTMDEYGRLLPAENRFPSAAGGFGFRTLSDFVHSLGLKYGIHILRGIPRQAVHQNVKIKGTDISARQIASPNSICQWNTDMYGINADADGAAQYYDSLFELYALWGVDYVKVDDIARPYADREIELIRAAVEKCGRDMVLSISPGPAPLEQAEHLKQYVNMWRITDDFWDKWELLYDMFGRAEKWCVHSGAGHWPDADMLPVGAILQDYGENNRTGFTQDEQITMLSLWNMMRSPLMIGGEMTKLDEFTLNLLTNDAILEIGRCSHGARQVYKRIENGCEQIVWSCTHAEKNSRYIAVFNTSESKTDITVRLSECDLFGTFEITELWSGENRGSTDSAFTCTVNSHGAEVFELKKK